MATNCAATTPPIDDLCSDPAYRAAHPDECANFTVLLLQPENSLTEPGETVTYVVKLRANGTEIVLEQGLEFFSSNPGAAVINQNGVATGVAAGISTISVTWQNLSASAQLQVVDSCAETHQNFLLLIDNSKSMGQSFSSTHPTKLAFSKSIARDFCDTVNLEKDKLAVMRVGDSGELLQAWTDDAAEAQTAIQGIASSTQKSDLKDGVDEASGYFASSGVEGVNVIIMFSDGEFTGDTPLPIAQSFKDSSGIFVSVAVRAWGDGFVVMAEMSTGGFLMSAYGETEDDILTILSGLKSFLCASACYPESAEAPYAELNYNDFINWDVVQGRVDLVGLDRWDVVPNNGLYVDLMGSRDFPGEEFGYGKIQSKEPYTFEAGKTYRITHYAAGNNVNATGTFKHVVACGSEFEEEITITDKEQPFEEYEFEWTQAVTEDGYITFEQTEKGGHYNVGTLIDEITLYNVTDAETLLYDNFDSENPTVLDNPGYSYGCLETVPGATNADPTPPVKMVE